MGKEHTHTFWLITSLILMDFQSGKRNESFPTIPVCRSMSKMSKIDQIHIRAVMLKDVKPLKVCGRCRRSDQINAMYVHY